MKDSLKEEIQVRMNGCPGKKGFYYKNLHTGKTFGICENDSFLAASVIKLPIFAAIMVLAARGEADLNEQLTVTESDKLPGCGALCSFTGDVTTDVRTLCRLMITISDNTATNVLIRRFDIERLNGIFAGMGLEKTRVNRLLFDSEAAARGAENVIVPAEMGVLLEQISKGTFQDQKTSKEMWETLLRQQINHKLCGKLGEEVPVAHKTGEDDGITNDVGIVYGKRPFVICFGYNGPDVSEFEQHIREITWELYREASR